MSALLETIYGKSDGTDLRRKAVKHGIGTDLRRKAVKHGIGSRRLAILRSMKTLKKDNSIS